MPHCGSHCVRCGTTTYNRQPVREMIVLLPLLSPPLYDDEASPRRYHVNHWQQSWSPPSPCSWCVTLAPLRRLFAFAFNFRLSINFLFKLRHGRIHISRYPRSRQPTFLCPPSLSFPPLRPLTYRPCAQGGPREKRCFQVHSIHGRCATEAYRAPLWRSRVCLEHVGLARRGLPRSLSVLSREPCG